MSRIGHFEMEKMLHGGQLFGEIFLGLIWGHPVFLTPYNGVKNM
jgi:hypothetical protein